MSTPDLHLKTLFVLNREGRITATREPGASRGPLFSLVRSSTRCAWAVREDVPEDLARQLDALAQEEPPILDLRDIPVHANQYMSLLGARMKADGEAGGMPRQS